MIIIKIGGSIVDGLHSSTIQDIAKFAKNGLVIVHGGGKDVSSMCEKLGKEPKFVTSPSGIRSRYTDKETIQIFTMVMAGKINTSIVQQLQQHGINAIGLCGADANFLRADRKKKLLIMNENNRRQAIDGGYTGKIKSVNDSFLHSLLDMGLVPVISPLALSEDHEFLNVDGDRAAASVAGAMHADTVLFITNVDGLLMEDKLVSHLTLQEAKDIRPKIGPGMEKKILASTEALDMGVRRAIIANGTRENPISCAINHEKCTVISND